MNNLNKSGFFALHLPFTTCVDRILSSLVLVRFEQLLKID